jgi:hypothetical protein
MQPVGTGSGVLISLKRRSYIKLSLLFMKSEEIRECKVNGCCDKF